MVFSDVKVSRQFFWQQLLLLLFGCFRAGRNAASQHQISFPARSHLAPSPLQLSLQDSGTFIRFKSRHNAFRFLSQAANCIQRLKTGITGVAYTGGRGIVLLKHFSERHTEKYVHQFKFQNLSQKHICANFSLVIAGFFATLIASRCALVLFHGPCCPGLAEKASRGKFSQHLGVFENLRGPQTKKRFYDHNHPENLRTFVYNSLRKV